MCLLTFVFFFFIEKKLLIVKDELELNVSRSEDFAIPCHIADQSSGESKFQVTWFWQKETGIQKWPIFVAYRNATLQDMLGAGHQLRFGHPVPHKFSLTISKPAPENSGLYFCEVEEWLPSLSHGWRKVAVDTSGHLIVNVFTEGEHHLTRCEVAWTCGRMQVFTYIHFFALLCRRRRVQATMQVRYLDRDSCTACHMLTVGDIPAGAEDMQDQRLRRKEVRRISLGRGTPAEYQTRCRGLSLIGHKWRGERRRRAEVEKYSLIFFKYSICYNVL